MSQVTFWLVFSLYASSSLCSLPAAELQKCCGNSEAYLIWVEPHSDLLVLLTADVMNLYLTYNAMARLLSLLRKKDNLLYLTFLLLEVEGG